MRDKVTGYWQAVELSSTEYFPYVVFVVKDEPRRRELARIFRRLPEEQREMVRVCLLDELLPRLLDL